ncbi:hypothetical protein GALL_338840 [mine drainage metagenome]|uniref:Uncharacterized protein n=1 Tax=mine drainage metagenome TaxID=410659 RepID=A0A1J5QWR2_9ZZZZ
MADASIDDIINEAQRALWRAASLARVSQAFAEARISEPSDDEMQRDEDRSAIKDALETLARDAAAAADGLADMLAEARFST